MKTIKHLFTVLLLLCTTTVSAHDFEVDGIYYRITNTTNKTVMVTYKGYNYDDYNNEYTGSVVIPGSVTYNGATYSVTSIGNSAFWDCSALTNIVIPNSVTIIDMCVFSGCTGLTDIVIPNSVTSIGISAFNGCTGLTSVEIPNSVTSIRNNAFADCTGLKRVVVGNGVTSIANYVFSGCTSLTSIEIPNSVTSIGDYAFEGCSALTSIEIPNGVVSIGGDAFCYCSNLESIVIPNSVISIGEDAFYNCTGLKRVVVGNGVTSIGEEAFYYCNALQFVVNLSNLIFCKGSSDYGYIAYYADKIYNAPNGSIEGDFIFDNPNGVNTLLYYLGNATEITLPADYKDETYIIGEKAFYGNTIITNVEIPNSVTSIASSALEGCVALTSVEIPNSVTSIGSSAFRGCTGLTSIQIPNSVTSIGSSAFRGCTNLKTVVNFSNQTFSKGSSNNGYIAYYADKIYNAPNGSMEGDFIFGRSNDVNKLLYYLGNDAELTLPEDYKDETYIIGEKAFYGNTIITNVKIPSSVTSIASSAFEGCVGLASIEIPNSVTSIGSSAFRDCTNLKTVVNFSNQTFSKGSSNNGYIAYYADKIYNAPNGSMEGDFIFGRSNDVNKLLYYLGNDAELTLPEDYKGEYYVIGEDVFYGNTTIISIVIPNSVKSIGERAFRNCTSLTSIEIPNSVTSIGNNAFLECSNLAAVHIGDIAAWCNIDFGNYSANPLYYAHNLYLNGDLVTDLVIPESVTSIKYAVFYNCSNLTYVDIPSNVISINESAFRGCSAIACITIPNNVTSIGGSAFRDCTSLKTVINFSNLTFSKGSSNNGYIAYYANKVYNLPEGFVENGFLLGKINSVNTLVGYLGNEVELTLPFDYKGENYVIGTDAFYGNTTITSVIIPNSVTSLGDNAFRNCNSLANIEIPNSVTNIGERAFSGCTSLEELCIEDGNSVLSLDGKLIFYDCPLETVYLGRTLSYNTGFDYNYSPFYDKSTLVSAIIGDNVAYIKEYLFKDCENLESAIIGANVENISKYAFSGCASLVNIAIPDSVTSIGESAFSDCTGLECVSIGKSVKNIYKNAFKNCHNLSGVFITDLTAWCNIKFDGNYSNPLCFAHHLYLNDKIVKELILPSDIIEIKELTFKGCNSFTSVTVPNNIKYIRSGAFTDCDSLKKVYINDLSAWCNIDFESTPLYYANNLYLNGDLVTDLLIPNNVTSIKHLAFYHCTSLKSVEIPNSVTNIGNSAFAGCTGLTSITIPNCVTSIGERAFSGCTSLTSIVVSNNVTSIEDYVFSDCCGLTSIKFSNSVTNIGEKAFSGCTSLTRIVIPNSVTSIGDKAFDGCTSLKDLRIEDGTQILNLGYNYYNATTGMPEGLFSYCPLETLYLGRNLSYDGDSYYGCSPFLNNVTLCSVTIGDNVASIGQNAFSYCTSLSNITIPNSIKSIGNSAFSGCTALNEVYISDLSAWCCIDFGNYSANPLSNSDNLYLNGEKITNLVIPDDVTEIKKLAFYGCSSLTDITILDGIKTIGNSAFAYCNNMETLYISNTIESIGDNAFAECNNLYEIKIGSKKVITANENIFSSDAYNNACLYVPTGRKDFYAKTSPWNNFIIQEMDFTGIDEVVDELKGEEEKVKVKGLCYDLTGRVVEKPTTGIYIIDGKKVFVK